LLQANKQNIRVFNHNMDFSNLKQYHKEKADIPIRYFQSEFKNGERILDEWQRLDRWSLSYKESFIKSLLESNDIPKIMEYTLKGDVNNKKRILDGGHRTRCIDEFMNSEFGVKIGDNYCYWEIKEEKTRSKSKNKNIELPEEYKHNFLNYKLTVTTYIELTDQEARVKFNELNHCNPMNNAEVINSHSSRLVDKLREFWDITDKELCEELKKIFSLSKKDLDKLNYMKVLISLYSLIERDGKDDVFNYCEPKNALIYTRANDDEGLKNQLTGEEFDVPWSKFVDSYNNYKEWIEEMFEKGFQLFNHSESLTYFHYMNEYGLLTEIENIKICEFTKRCDYYKTESPKYEKELKNVKNKPNSKIQEAQGKLKKLDQEVGQEVVDWLTTFQNNGSGKQNLNKRKIILDKVLK